MGKISKDGKRIGKRAYPLCKIISMNMSGWLRGIKSDRLNLLECGHYVYPSTDMYGYTSPVRQRCRECYNERSNKM